MEIFLWLVINAVVGAAIGARKNMAGGAIALSIFLGPIGWIIALVMEGNFRKCPFCAENVKDQAIVCPHCQRDLPKPKIVEARDPEAGAKSMRAFVIVAGVIVTIFVITIAVAIYHNAARSRAQADIDQRSADVRNLYSNTSATTITSAPPEFVRLTDDFSVYSTKGDEIKLPVGTRLQVLARYEHDLTVEYKGGNYPIPSAFTEPSK
jgi:zinc ribbon protein